MGIKKEFFLTDNFDIFICPICKHVASDPVLASCCEATFCSTCFNDTMKCDTDSCAGCNQQVSYGIKVIPLQKQLKQIYQQLTLKCEDCDQEVTIGNRNEHDCPAKVFNCINCGFNDHVLRRESHDCINWLKDEYEKLRLTVELIKEESVKRESDLMNENDQLRAMFEEFMRRNGAIELDNDGIINVQLNGADNLARFRPRTGLNVSTRPIEVVFNESETKASPEIREKLVQAIKEVVKPGEKLYHNLMRVRDLIRTMIGGHWFLHEKEKIGQGFNYVPSSYCSFTFDGRHYVAFKNQRSRIFVPTASKVSTSEKLNVSKFDMNASRNADFKFLENYTFATKKVREKVKSAIMMTIDQPESYRNGIFTESFRFGSVSDSETNDWIGTWRLLAKDSIKVIASGNYSFDPKTFCTISVRGQLYIAFKCVRGPSGKLSRKHPDVELIRMKMKELSNLPEFFGAQTSNSKAEKNQDENVRRESKDEGKKEEKKEGKDREEEKEKKEDFQSATRTRFLEPRNALGVSKDGLNLSTEVEFNQEETFATEEVKKYVKYALIEMENFPSFSMNEIGNISSFTMTKKFRDYIRKYMAGQWHIYYKNDPNVFEYLTQMIPTTFCSFTFRDHRYIAFKRSQAKYPRKDDESVRIRKQLRSLERKWFGKEQPQVVRPSETECGLNVSTNVSKTVLSSGVIFNERETFASEEIKTAVLGAVSSLTSDGSKLDQKMNSFRSAMHEFIQGQWYLYIKNSLPSVDDDMHVKFLIPSTFCSFSLGDNQYIAFKKKRSGKNAVIDTDPQSIILRGWIKQWSQRKDGQGTAGLEQGAVGGQDVSKTTANVSKTDPKQSEANASKSETGVEFNAKETFAPLKIKKDISAIIQNSAKNGKNLPNFSVLKSELEKKLAGNWFIQSREKLPSILATSIKDQIVVDTFCSFTFRGDDYIAFKREDGAGNGILMDKILQFGLGIETGAIGGQPVPIRNESNFKPGSGLNVSKFDHIIDSSDEEDSVHATMNGFEPIPDYDKLLMESFSCIKNQSLRNQLKVSMTKNELTYLGEYTFAITMVTYATKNLMFGMIDSQVRGIYLMGNQSLRHLFGQGFRLLEGARAPITALTYNFDPQTFCTFIFRGHLYIVFNSFPWPENASPSINSSERNFINQKMIELQRHLQGWIPPDAHVGTPKPEHAFMSLVRIPNEEISKFSFNENETLAPSEIRQKVVSAITRADQQGHSLIHMQFDIVCELIKEMVPGEWNVLKRSSLGWALILLRPIANTFLSFSCEVPASFEKRSFIAFRSGNEEEFKQQEKSDLMKKLMDLDT